MQGSNTDDKIPSSFTIKPLSPKLKAKEFESPPPRRFPRPSEDSQISTSSDSSNASSRNSLGQWHDTKEEDTKYPNLLHIKTLKTRSATQSLKESDVIDAPVEEEGEEQEMENQFLKKLPVVADGQEFISKRTHSNRFRDNMFNTDLSRCRSLEASFLPLDSVQEDKNEEDINAFKQRRKLRLYSLKMEDLNEFNQNNQGERTPHDRSVRRNMSMQMGEEVIVEEQENKVLPHLQSIFGSYSSLNGSRRGSGLLSSPGTKLRVDEIDFLGPKFEGKEDDSDENDIDPIMEEMEEKNGQNEENKEFQVAMAKMNEEREFMKKVIKGEEIDEIDSQLSRRNTEREFYTSHVAEEEIIEEDNNENIGN